MKEMIKLFLYKKARSKQFFKKIFRIILL